MVGQNLTATFVALFAGIEAVKRFVPPLKFVPVLNPLGTMILLTDNTEFPTLLIVNVLVAMEFTGTLPYVRLPSNAMMRL